MSINIDTKALRDLLAKATPGPVEYAADSGAIIGEATCVTLSASIL